MSAIDAKREIRKRIKAVREENPCPDSSLVVQEVLDLPEWQDASTVMMYCALPGEVDLTPLLGVDGKRIVLPLVSGNDLLLKEYVPGSLVPGYAGIMEPSSNAPDVASDEIDLVLVPGVAFDRCGRRLGRGKGYYDRTLKSLDCKKVGVAFSWQIVDAVPVDEWDLPMDILVVDGNVINRRR